MKLHHRIIATLVALGWCVWAGANQVRHFAGTPDRSLAWLLVAPAIACLITLLGLTVELAGVSEAGARILEWLGFALISYRSLWMFFSWDGSYLFPAWCLIALALYRFHPRWQPIA
ncbi:MAG TPA: hypothetical protein VN709_06245 [Terriglobales bacterium]|nr:hypothetical protein [Terriglobales bacterium]